MTLSNEEKFQLLQLKEMKLARESMLDFTLWTFPGYEVNWHHKLICDVLDRFVYTNKINRLMILTAPRHGKSEIISRRLPAFLLGINPNNRIIGLSYSADLAGAMNRDVQRVIDSDSYKRIFIDTKLSNGHDKVKRTDDLFEIINAKGFYKSAGIMGGVTGAGADYLFIDDPIKNQEEADSATYRQKLWNEYASTAYTRLEKNGKIAIIMTRWHEDDLAGRLLELAKNDPAADQWHVLRLPAIAADAAAPRDPRRPGEALWPNKYSIETLLRMRATVGLRAWNGLFQQRPASVEGGLFKRHLWKFYDRFPEKFDTIIQSWDLAFKKKEDSDKIACSVIGKAGASLYLLDQIDERMSFTESLTAVRNMSQKWPNARAKLVEAKANGDALVDILKTEIPGLILVEPKGGKVARAEAITPFHEAGNLFLPNPNLSPWVQSFIEQHANFPNVKHDDQVDSFSQGVNYLLGDPRDRLKKLLGG